MTNKNYISWNNYSIILDENKILSSTLIRATLTDFWNENLKKYLRKGDKHISIIFRVQYEDGTLASLGKLQKLNRGDLEYYINYVIDRVGLLNDSYSQNKITRIIFSHATRDGLAPKNEIKFRDLITHSHNKHKLPISFTPLGYGKVIHTEGNTFTIMIDNILIILTQVEENNTKINKIKYFKNGTLLFEWFDKLLSDSSFLRTIGKTSYLFKIDEIVLTQALKASNSMK
jgi:hypothetical protein